MWDDLNMNQKAEVISMAVKAGLRDIDSIRSFYENTIKENRFDDGGRTYIGGADQELVVTPEQTFMQPITDRDPYVDYQFYSPTGNSIVQTINSTPRWQQYWADQEGSRVSNAMHKASPKVLDLLTAVDGVATGPEAIEGLYGLYNLAKSGVRNGVRRIATAAKTAPKITAKNAANITPEQWTAAQDIAIARGDMEEAQRLRDLHFMANSPNNKAISSNNMPLPSYHTVGDRYNPNFTEFNPEIEGRHSSIYTTDNPFMSGSYTTKLTSEAERNNIIEVTRQRELDKCNELLKNAQNIKAANSVEKSYKEDAIQFAKKQIDIYSNPKKARKQILSDHQWVGGPIENKRMKSLYVNLENPLVLDNYGNGWNNMPLHQLPQDVWDLIKPDIHSNLLNASYTTRSLEEAQRAVGRYDGSIINNVIDYGGQKQYGFAKPGTVFQVNNPNNIKLADAVTYDNNGIRIPLGLRDNFKLNDIRYGLIPLGLGLGAATLPKKKEYALGGPLVNMFDGGGPIVYAGMLPEITIEGTTNELKDAARWARHKLGSAKRYLEDKASRAGNLSLAFLEASADEISNFLAEKFLEDDKRKQKYQKERDASARNLDAAIRRFKGESAPIDETSRPTRNIVSAEERGIKPNAYNQFNSNVQRKTKEDYIQDLKSMSKEELMTVQQQLADEGKYDRKLSGSKKYIKSVQRNLIKEGYLPEGEDDGIVGPKTQGAYNNWLRKANVDGILGNKTINAYLSKDNTDVSTKGIDGCAQWTTLKYESMADGKSLQNGVVGNAWEMIKNIENKGGSILYNIYDDEAFENIRSVDDLKSKTVRALKQHPLDFSNLQIGDVVGIYMPSSDMHETALKDGTTKNTHVGIITGFDKDGIPIVEHNIHQDHRRDPITKITGSKYGRAQVSAVARPANVNIKVDVKETKWNNAKSKFKVDKKYDNPTIDSFANSMAGIAPQIQKIYPDVDMDAVQEIALAVQKRETNFMTNNTSSQGLFSQIKEKIGDKYRKLKGQTEFSKSSDLAKMKMSSLTENERQFLGIKSKKDMENPKKAGAAAALYLARNMNYLMNVRKMNPNLNLSDEDIYNLTILSYNQDISDIGFDRGKMAPEEIENIRAYYDPNAKIKDINSTKYKHFGIFGDLAYENLEDGFTPYIGAAKDAAAKYITKKTK